MATLLHMLKARPDLQNAVRRSRRLLHRRALVAATVSAVPVPGLDWAVDATLLTRLIPAISAEFGLMPDQVDRMTPAARERIKQAMTMVGSALLGRVITHEVVLRMTHTLGLRLTAKQAARYVPLVGQVASAAMGYATLRYLGEQHIRNCAEVLVSVNLILPASD